MAKDDKNSAQETEKEEDSEKEPKTKQGKGKVKYTYNSKLKYQKRPSTKRGRIDRTPTKIKGGLNVLGRN